MTLDWNLPDVKILGRYLKPGDCIRVRSHTLEEDGNDTGIIIATTFFLDKRGLKLKEFYLDEPAYEFYDINSSTDGLYSSRLNPDKEFDIIRSRKDILYIYEKIEFQLLSKSADLIQQRNDLIDIKLKAFAEINYRENILKKNKEG